MFNLYFYTTNLNKQLSLFIILININMCYLCAA